MPKRTYFYAAGDDLLETLQRVEDEHTVKYVEAGLFSSAVPREFACLSDLPQLGTARGGDMNHIPRYLILPAEAEVIVRAVPQRRGGIRYAIDMQENPDAVELTPGGIFEDVAVISGRLDIVSNSPVSHSLYTSFAAPIKRGLSHVHTYYIGPRAAELWDAGYRLTQSVHSPPEYDLRNLTV